MKTFDSLKNKKWIGRGFDLKEESIVLLKSANINHSIQLSVGKYSLRLTGKKRTGSGTIYLEVLSDDNDVLLKKKIDFSNSSWTEYSFSFDSKINGLGKIKLLREKNIYGSVELGRIFLDLEGQAIFPKIISNKTNLTKTNFKYLNSQLSTLESKRKIAFIIPYKIYGGAEIYLETLIPFLILKYDITILYLQNNYLQNKLEKVNHRNVKNLEQLSGILKSNYFDYIFYYNRAEIYNLLLEIKKNDSNFSKIIEIYHSDFTWQGSLSLIKRRDFLDLFLAVSPSIGRHIDGNFARKELPVSLNLNKFRKNKFKNREYKRYKGVIGTVARISIEKNIDYIVDLAAIMTDYQFLILGEGPDEDRINNKIKDLRLNNCKLLGFVNNVEEHYLYFDAFVLASKMEGTPISILEAMASEVPVFTNMVGAIPDIVKDQVTGFKIYNDPNKDAEIIKNNMYRQDVINNALNYVSNNHSVEMNSKKMINYLISISSIYTGKSEQSILLPGEFI